MALWRRDAVTWSRSQDSSGAAEGSRQAMCEVRKMSKRINPPFTPEALADEVWEDESPSGYLTSTEDEAGSLAEANPPEAFFA